MSLTPHELDRMADDIYLNRRIIGSIFCEKCGYNLKTLPYVHRCPECGSDYNARPLTMKGIFFPGNYDFPGSRMTSALFFLALGGLLVNSAGTGKDTVMCIAAAAVVAVGLLQSYKTWQSVLRYWHAKEIAVRIAKQEAEDEYV